MCDLTQPFLDAFSASIYQMNLPKPWVLAWVFSLTFDFFTWVSQFFWVFHSIFEEFYKFSNRAGPVYCEFFVCEVGILLRFLLFLVHFLLGLKRPKSDICQSLEFLLEFWVIFLSFEFFHPWVFFERSKKRGCLKHRSYPSHRIGWK